MKTVHLLLSLLFCCYFSIAKGQTVSYGYDAAGNRINRVIDLSPLRSAEVDTQEEPQVFSEVLKGLEIRIYPNPTDGILKVEVMGLSEGKEARFSLYALSGVLIVDKRSASGVETLDLTGQSAGTYVLRIAAGEEKSEWKVIKK